MDARFARFARFARSMGGNPAETICELCEVCANCEYACEGDRQVASGNEICEIAIFARLPSLE